MAGVSESTCAPSPRRPRPVRERGEIVSRRDCEEKCEREKERTAKTPRVGVARIVERDVVLLAARDLDDLLALDGAFDEKRLALDDEENARAGDVLARLQVRDGCQVTCLPQIMRHARPRTIAQSRAWQRETKPDAHLSIPKHALLARPDRKHLAALGQQQRMVRPGANLDDLLGVDPAALDAPERTDVLSVLGVPALADDVPTRGPRLARLGHDERVAPPARGVDDLLALERGGRVRVG